MATPFLPQARRTGDLVIQELGDETLVYDRARHKISYLDPTASLVWKYCDGKTKKVEVARLLNRKLQLGGNTKLKLALHHLQQCHLIV